MKHVFIIGSKGIPGAYGGYETFLDRLTEYHEYDTKLKYHVACKGTVEKHFEYHNADCFQIKVPNIGSAQAILYDILALRYCVNYIKQNQIQKPIVYILACRIGPFMNHYVNQVHSLGGVVFVNPDGHEWLRAKWSYAVRRYWKISEQLMVKHADLLICDSLNIEKYIQSSYKQYRPNTKYIAYGADVSLSSSDVDAAFHNWLQENAVKKNQYYLIVGRFVPENNYESMIREFMASKTSKSLVIITTQNGKFFRELNQKLQFDQDARIKFVGTVYNQELLKKIREEAFGYLHGHEVGGTNPSLLEALSSTPLNLLLNVGFNQEVGRESALYWTKEPGSLRKLIEKCDQLSDEEISTFSFLAKKRISDAYSWKFIANEYKNTFLV